MKVNIAGYITLTKDLIQYMKKNSKIVFVGSTEGQYDHFEIAGSQYVKNISSIDDPAFSS